jgi:hypothetical protein
MHKDRPPEDGTPVGTCVGCGSLIVIGMGWVVVAGPDDDPDLLCEYCVEGHELDDVDDWDPDWLDPYGYPGEDDEDEDWIDEL